MVKCRNCGNFVEPKLDNNQILIAIFLTLFFIAGGLIYIVLASKEKCPVCGSNVYRKEFLDEQKVTEVEINK